MKNLITKALLLALTVLPLSAAAQAPPGTKIVALDFQLNNLTALPAGEKEMARIEFLSKTFKEKLAEDGLELVQPSEELQAKLTDNDATYLFDRPELAAKLAKDSGADYLALGLALKPTYLFVYPRIKLIDLKTQQPVLSGYVQLESSAQDNSTTAHSAAQLAKKIADFVQATTAKAK